MRRSREGFWQSFADLAMGTMAVIMLVLLLVLAQQTRADQEFRDQLRRALVQGQKTASRQQRLRSLIAEIFRESNCPLRFDPQTGRLAAGEGETANLYPPGGVQLSAAGRDALNLCGTNFLTLVVCFDKRPDFGPACRALLEGFEGKNEEGEAARRFDELQELRGQVESMVLEGNTDKSIFLGTPPIAGLVRPPEKGSASGLRLEQYTSNAYLGAERARQAAGHLVHVVARAAEKLEVSLDELDPTDALFGLLSIESGAFGRYLAGPKERRRPSSCGGSEACAEARNLSLQLRWTEGSLREPFEAIVKFYCDSMRAGASKGGFETTEGDRVQCRGERRDEQ